MTLLNKALLESVAQITEMTRSDHPTAAARVKSADKMVMCCHYSMIANLKWQSNTTRDSTST